MSFSMANQFVLVTFLSPEGKEMVLKYQLYDHCLRERWVELMLEGKDRRFIENGGFFFGRRFHEERDLEARLNECIKKINQFSEKFKFSEIYIPLVAKAPMTTEFLNLAHKYFEKIDKYKKLKIFEEFVSVAHMFNMTIHQAECFTELGNFPTDHIQLLMQPASACQLQMEDYKLFSIENKFGGLYLPYGMTGVPTKDAYILGVEPIPQTVYSTGMMLSFMSDFIFDCNNNFKEWLSKHNLSLLDPRSAVGLIPLGILTSPPIHNRDFFLDELKKFSKVSRVDFI